MTVSYLAYHGTTKKSAESILSTQRYDLSTKNDEWLGDGIYFFVEGNELEINAKENAKKWAIRWNKNCGKLAYIKNEIEIPKDKLLNLDEGEGRDIFKFLVDDLEKILNKDDSFLENFSKERGIKINVKDRAEMETLRYNYVAKYGEFDGFVQERVVNYYDSAYPTGFRPNCRMLVIRNNKYIQHMKYYVL